MGGEADVAGAELETAGVADAGAAAEVASRGATSGTTAAEGGAVTGATLGARNAKNAIAPTARATAAPATQTTRGDVRGEGPAMGGGAAECHVVEVREGAAALVAAAGDSGNDGNASRGPSGDASDARTRPMRSR